MLHLAIIGIVCAVSAPREGTEIIGGKNYGSDAVYHFDEGARKEAKPFSPRVYNVVAHNSSVFGKQKVTNRTNPIKQCQSSRSSLCSVMENIFSRTKESFNSDVGLVFSKRSLLWSTNTFSPKTLRPPMENQKEFEKSNRDNCMSQKSRSNCPRSKSKRPKCRLSKRKKKLKPSGWPERYDLDYSLKKKLLLLKKTHKRHLDEVKTDDELDLNKRIQKLIKKIVVENQRTAQAGHAGQSAGAVASSGGRSDKMHKSFPFFKKLKKMFRFTKNYFDNKQTNNGNPNSVPVNSVRDEVPVADKTAHLNNYDVFNTMRKTTRFRRNPYRNYVSYSQRDNPLPRYMKTMKVKKPYRYSNHFKKKAKFLYPQYKEKLFPERPHGLLFGPRSGMKSWPYNKPLILKPNIKGARLKRRNAKFDKSKPNDDAADSGEAQNGKKLGADGTAKITTESDHLEKLRDESPPPENLSRSNNEDVIPDHTLEKPFLERHFRYDFLNERGPPADLKTFEDRYNLQPDFPLYPTALHPSRRPKYDLHKEGYLNPYRYLKIRHALRNYLIHNNILIPSRLDSPNEREKRCGGSKCCPLPHKCWRSPPLLCIPYIRKSQDDLLRYLIKTMQKLIGKPFPPKIDIFDSTKYKPCGKAVDHTCDDNSDEDDVDCECMTVTMPPCVPMQPCPPPPPTTPKPCQCQMPSAAKICSCSPPLIPIPRSCARAPCHPSPQPYLPSQRICPYRNYNPQCEYPPIENVYPPVPVASDYIEPIAYPTQNYCGYNEPLPPAPPPCMPINPYFRSFPSPKPPSMRSLSMSSPSLTEYVPTPPSDALLRTSEQAPVAFTPSSYSSPSTSNACSWYMSKSPIERAEYFAYTALPYIGPPECVTSPSQLELFNSANHQPPYPPSNAPENQPNSPKFNVQMAPASVDRPPAAASPVVNPQSITERSQYENQCKGGRKILVGAKQSDEVNVDQMNQFRKEERGPKSYDAGGNFKENPPGIVRCDDQQHHLVENQMLKPEMSTEYPKNGNKANIQNAYRYVDQQVVSNNHQLPKVEANSECGKLLSKEENSQVVQNPHPMIPIEANEGGNKNQNRECSYSCGSQQYSLNEPQIPKPEMNLKEKKNPNKEESFRCTDQQHALNDQQQIPKPEINDENDDRRFFKIKHHKGILKNFRKPSMEFFHSYDDYYDRYPYMDPEDLSSFRYSKSPFMRPWRGFSRKAKKSSKRGSSKRQKRGDNYYTWSDSFENYNDYDSDFGSNAEPSDDSKFPDEAFPDPNWIPPSYEMFSELAKAVTETGSKVSDNNSVVPDDKISINSLPNEQSLESVAGKVNDNITKKILKINAKNASASLNETLQQLASSVKAETEDNFNTTEANTDDALNKTATTSEIYTSVAHSEPATNSTVDTRLGQIKSANTSAGFSNVFHRKLINTNANSTSVAPSEKATTSKTDTSVVHSEPATTSTINTTASHIISSTTSTTDTSMAHTTHSSTSSNITTSASYVTLTTAASESKTGSGESIDSKKSGKTGFFQSNSKGLGIQPNSGFLSTIKIPKMGSAREDKELDGDQDLDSAEEGQIPTTLKMASIVKGPKKQFTKPSPKVYTRIYPDSMAIETEANETTTTTAATTAKAVVERTTLAVGSTSDIQVQLLAVCEGYLEVIKLIKAQNHTLGDDLDADLARYCENIISQNFNLQSDSSKPKKQETIQSSTPPAETNSTVAPQTTKNPKKNDSNCSSWQTLQTAKIPQTETTGSKHRGKIIVDTLNNPLYKNKLYNNAKTKNWDFKRKKFSEYEDINYEGIGPSGRKQRSQFSRRKSNKRKNSYFSIQSNSKYLPKKAKRYRRKEQSEEELLKKGITKEQIELLHLLRKRKRALLSWLYNSRDLPKPSDAQETEYFDDEDEIARGSDIPTYSDTITSKEYEETSTTTTQESEWSFVNESVFPVYAKQYGYDRGGELMEVEVLWRKINEKTHEKKIFRNRSVLALLLTSTREPITNLEDTRLIAHGFDNEELSEIQSKSESKIGYVDPVANLNKKTSIAPALTKTKNSSSTNNTFTYIKPDPSSIVGAPPNVTTLHPNNSRKISHKFGAARDLFQEYTLEFLNYAVYILPIMFTVLFVFCCLCCAVQILKSKKSTNRHKKKKKRQISTDESDTTEDSELESKQKRREARRKKHSKDNADNLEKKRSKAFWNVLKLNSAKPNSEFNDDSQTEKKKSFLRFLKGRREEDKAEFSGQYNPVHEADELDAEKHDSDSNYLDSRKRKDDNPNTHTQSEAEERRELIALLEELKKIETEKTAEKKEVKSVHVQYMTQEDDSPVFQRPEFAFPYEKNVFGMPKGYSPCNKHFSFYQSDPATLRDYELFEDVNELTELLPCECNYYSKRNDYLRRCDFKINQEGGCKSFIKIFRDAGVTRSKPFREKNLFKNESENRSLIFNKYRSISTDTSDELMGVTQKNAGTEVRLTDNTYETASPFKLRSKKKTDFVEEMDSLKRQLKNKKHVRLKDDGVLCRL